MKSGRPNSTPTHFSIFCVGIFLPANHLLMGLTVGYGNIFVGHVAAEAAPGPRPAVEIYGGAVIDADFRI